MTRRRDPFGFTRVCFRRDTGASADSLRSLLEQNPFVPRTIDRHFLQNHLSGKSPGDRTVLESIAELPPGHALAVTPDGPAVAPWSPLPDAGDLAARLADAVERALAGGGRCAVALSGGLDSAIVLALTGRRVPAYVLDPSLPGYSERAEALRTARTVGAEVVVVEASEDDFREALPAAVAAVECPLYNAHPVGKLLLARAMARDGVTLALSGDGADHVVKRDASADYLPLARDLFRAAGVSLVSPFLDDAVVAHLLALPPDPGKPALRAVGAGLGVVRELVAGPKLGRWCPPLRRDGLPSHADRERLEDALGAPLPPPADDPAWMRQTTAAMLLAALGPG